jgi:hypothetical protein
MPDQPLAANSSDLVSMSREKSIQFGLDRLCDQLPRT